MSPHPLRTLIETCDAAISRRATYVFRKEPGGQWRCTVDNSYGTTLLGAQQPGDRPATD